MIKRKQSSSHPSFHDQGLSSLSRSTAFWGDDDPKGEATYAQFNIVKNLHPTVAVVAGPTGSGKTTAMLKVCQQFQEEYKFENGCAVYFKVSERGNLSNCFDRNLSIETRMAHRILHAATKSEEDLATFWVDIRRSLGMQQVHIPNHPHDEQKYKLINNNNNNNNNNYSINNNNNSSIIIGSSRVHSGAVGFANLPEDHPYWIPHKERWLVNSVMVLRRCRQLMGVYGSAPLLFAADDVSLLGECNKSLAESLLSSSAAETEQALLYLMELTSGSIEYKDTRLGLGRPEPRLAYTMASLDAVTPMSPEICVGWIMTQKMFDLIFRKTLHRLCVV